MFLSTGGVVCQAQSIRGPLVVIRSGLWVGDGGYSMERQVPAREV